MPIEVDPISQHFHEAITTYGDSFPPQGFFDRHVATFCFMLNSKTNAPWCFEKMIHTQIAMRGIWGNDIFPALKKSFDKLHESVGDAVATVVETHSLYSRIGARNPNEIDPSTLVNMFLPFAENGGFSPASIDTLKKNLKNPGPLLHKWDSPPVDIPARIAKLNLFMQEMRRLDTVVEKMVLTTKYGTGKTSKNRKSAKNP